ncbi:hypothetical protein DFP73DRAFT_563290 [Morchella snyderi]|nr:hypothetical protein DFP73DRAFT_563290 [Morchella snyderi]
MDIVLQQLEPLLAALRPHLTPITAQLPTSIANPISDLITPACYSTLILKLDPASSPACTQLALSKAIGVGIITLSTIVKIPQLIKLLKSGSARGVSFSSYALETAGYLCTLAYNFRSGNPISTYGEIGLIAVQNVVIAVLILHYSGKDMWAAAFVPVVAGALYALFNEGMVDPKLMGYLQAATIPLTLASKVPQIITVARNKSTGSLSAFAVFNYLFGSLARVFTTLAEVEDPLILYGFLGGAFLNFVLAAQMLWYWNSGKKLGAPTPAKKRYTGGRSPAKGKGAPKRKG